MKINLRQGFSTFSLHQNHLEDLLKHRLLDTVPQHFQISGPVIGPRNLHFYNFPGDTAPRPTVKELDESALSTDGYICLYNQYWYLELKSILSWAMINSQIFYSIDKEFFISQLWDSYSPCYNSQKLSVCYLCFTLKPSWWNHLETCYSLI